MATSPGGWRAAHHGVSGVLVGRRRGRVPRAGGIPTNSCLLLDTPGGGGRLPHRRPRPRLLPGLRLHLQRPSSTPSCPSTRPATRRRRASRRCSSSSPGTWPRAGSSVRPRAAAPSSRSAAARASSCQWMVEAGAGYGIGIDPGAPPRAHRRRRRPDRLDVDRRLLLRALRPPRRRRRRVPAHARAHLAGGRVHGHGAPRDRRPARHGRAVRAARRAAGARGGRVLGRLLRALLVLLRSARWPGCSGGAASRSPTSRWTTTTSTC